MVESLKDSRVGLRKPTPGGKSPGPRRTVQILFAFGLLGMFIAAAIIATDFQERSALTPLVTTLTGAALLALVCVREVLTKQPLSSEDTKVEQGSSPLGGMGLMWLLIYGVLFSLIGELGALLVFGVLLARYRGRQSWRRLLIVAFPVAIVFFVVTEVLLGESLFRGLIFEP